MEYLVEIVSDIDIQKGYAFIQDSQAGAINTFLGTVRASTSGEEVERLEFETYEPMAISEMEKIIHRASEQWPILKALVFHAVGTKQIGDACVFIGISSPHRDAAFSACRFIIDELKKSVPIWKKEYFANKSVWVSAHP